jgi:hypothetical protein
VTLSPLLRCLGSSLFMPVDSPDGTGGSAEIPVTVEQLIKRLRVARIVKQVICPLFSFVFPFH